jgi:hypothetical protein
MNNSNDFTYDREKFKNLPEFVEELHNVSTVSCLNAKDIQQNLVNSKLYYSTFYDTLNFSLNVCPKEEKFVQIYVVISKTLIICNLKENFAL